MWEWHYIFAALLTLAIVVRIVAMIKGQAQLPILKLLRAEGAQEKGKAAVHLLICMGIALMTLTGWFYYFHDALGFEKEAVHWVKELHEAVWGPLTALIGLHIAGVMKHEITTKEPIVSQMIHGD
jgi:cytochrome b561